MTEFHLAHLDLGHSMNTQENSSDSSTSSGGGIGGGNMENQQDSGSGFSSGGDSPQVVPDFSEADPKTEATFTSPTTTTTSISTSSSSPSSSSTEIVRIITIGGDVSTSAAVASTATASNPISIETDLLISASGGNRNPSSTTTMTTVSSTVTSVTSSSQAASSSRLVSNGIRTNSTTAPPSTSQQQQQHQEQQVIKIEPMTQPKLEGGNQMSTIDAAFLLASLGRDEGPRRASPPIAGASGKRPAPASHLDPASVTMAKKMRRPMDVKLPIGTVEELDMLEIQIEDSSALKAKLLNRLAKIGGKNFGQCVRNALKALMTDAVAVQLNWAGRGGKKPFQSYEIKSVLFDAVRMSFPKVTDFQLKDPVQCWLKRSRNYQPRDLKSRKKSNSAESWVDTSPA